MDVGELFREMYIAGVRSCEVTEELDKALEAQRWNFWPEWRAAPKRLYGILYEIEPDRSGWPVLGCHVAGCTFSGTPEEVYDHLGSAHE